VEESPATPILEQIQRLILEIEPLPRAAVRQHRSLLVDHVGCLPYLLSDGFKGLIFWSWRRPMATACMDNFVRRLRQPPQEVVLVHGEEKAKRVLCAKLRAIGVGCVG